MRRKACFSDGSTGIPMPMSESTAGTPCSKEGKKDLPWLSLPGHIQLAIARELDGKSLARLLCTCKSWRLILTVENDQPVADIWQSLCKEFLDPAQYGLHAAFVARLQRGQTKTDIGFFWRKLYYSARDLSSITWWPDGGKHLTASITRAEMVHSSSPVTGSSRDSSSMSGDSGSSPHVVPSDHAPTRVRNYASALTKARGHKRLSPTSSPSNETPEEVKELLARVGHSSSVVQDLQVIIGGLSEEGHALIDVVVIDHTLMTVSRPTVQCVNDCPLPGPRLRHTTTPITPSREGHPRFLLIGGYDLEGIEFGAGETYTLTILDDGKRVAWTQVQTTGEVPSPRFHHTADSLQDGRQVLLYGGEGSQVEDFVFQGPESDMGRQGSASSSLSALGPFQPSGPDLAPSPPAMPDPTGSPKATAAVVIYLLDVATLAWRKVPTTGPGPGPRALHQSAIHRCTRTGHERLVVVSGFSEKRLMDMKAYALDLVTLQWTCKPWTRWEDLPPARHRSASVRVGPDVLLLVGGARPTSSEFLNDVHALDMRSLTWIPVVVQSLHSSYDCTWKTSGHTANGLLIYGGCLKSPTGITPIPRLDPILIGDWTACGRREAV